MSETKVEPVEQMIAEMQARQTQHKVEIDRLAKTKRELLAKVAELVGETEASTAVLQKPSTPTTGRLGKFRIRLKDAGRGEGKSRVPVHGKSTQTGSYKVKFGDGRTQGFSPGARVTGSWD